ncbi:MAG: 2-oxoglutarate and iron-dependent oxygenase domain-containing protein [Chlamydiales bacterium]|jgi:isopenicillin N synthase-like dioxygenase|nr:2-oxoglutarate and iron-dependent oxygenase domain-containing protein [Chlamydiales bacterium]
MRKIILTICISFFSTVLAFDSTIPVLHLPDFYNESTRIDFLNNLEKAASEVGFFALTGAGIDITLLDSAYNQIIGYFNRDMNEKMAMKTNDGQRGYVPGESAKGENRIDFKEFFHIGRELSKEELKKLEYCKNVWPENPVDFKSTMIDLFQAMDKCKEALGDAITEVLH